MALIGRCTSATSSERSSRPAGEEIGRVQDIAVEAGRGSRAPSACSSRKENDALPPWEELSIFNKRIISSGRRKGKSGGRSSKEHLLIRKDLLDKQIVDIDGAKVVRVNDVKLTEEGGAAYVTDVDVGCAGSCDGWASSAAGRLLRDDPHPAPPADLLGVPPAGGVEARPLTLSVSREAVSDLHPADLAQIMSDLAPRSGRISREARHGDRGGSPPRTRAGGPGGPHLRDGQGAGGRHHRADAAGRGGGRHRGPPAEKAQELLQLMEKEEAQDIHELLHHEETPRGAHDERVPRMAPAITVGRR